MKEEEKLSDDAIDNEVFYNEEEDDDQDSPNPSNPDSDFEEYSEEEGDDDPASGSEGNALGQFFRVLVTPVIGWREVKGCKMKADAFAAGCFYPLLAIASSSVFVNIWYEDYSIALCLKTAIAVFVSFFVSYFLITGIAAKIMPGNAKRLFSADFGKKFVMTLLGSLALFFTLYTLFKPIEEVLIFLPIYTLFLVFRGEKFLRMPKDKVSLGICILSLLVVGVPVLIYYIFFSILLNG